MKKIYLKPETEIFKISIRDGVLENMASQVGEKVSDPSGGQNNFSPNVSDGESEEGTYSDPLGRQYNGTSIWDNAW